MPESAFKKLVESYPELKSCLGTVVEAFAVMAESFRGGGKLLLCGNGGSCSDADHIAGELMNRFERRRPVRDQIRRRLKEVAGNEGLILADQLQGSLPAIALASQNALGTAIANDSHPDAVFAQQVLGLGLDGDVLMAISTSGNSRNVLNAVLAAKALRMKVIGLTGSGGGNLAMMCDVTIRVPAEKTADIQELHAPVYHALCRALETQFFK